MRRVLLSGLIVAACVVAPGLVLQFGAEAAARRLCARMGGLIVSRPVPEAAPLTEVDAAMFPAGDPVLAELAHSRTDRAATAWGKGRVGFRPCLKSVFCLGAFEAGQPAYLDLSRGSDAALLVARPGVRCPEVATARSAAIKAEFERLGRAIRICAAGADAAARTLVVAQDVYTLVLVNPFRNLLQVHAWRVSTLTEPGRPLVSFTQVGVQTVADKLLSIVPTVMGIHENPIANRCTLTPSRHPGARVGVANYFQAGYRYSVGRFVDPGVR